MVPPVGRALASVRARCFLVVAQQMVKANQRNNYHHCEYGRAGGFKRSSQLDPSRLIEVAGQAILQAFSNQAFCGAVN